MNWRFVRRINVGKLVRVYLSKGGISTALGGKTIRAVLTKNGVSINSSIPGTGIFLTLLRIPFKRNRKGGQR